MTNIVLDIETVPQPLAELPPKLREGLWQWSGLASRLDPESYLEDPGAHPDATREIERAGAFRAETGQIVCVGVGHDLARALETHTFLARSAEEEARVLAEFWAFVARFSSRRLVTFNGLAFDVPFLLKRSMILGVPPTARLSLRRYAPHEHFDVMQVLANWSPGGAFSLGALAELFGLDKLHGLDGSAIGELWRRGHHEEVAAYCRRDVELTWALFERARPYFA